MGNNKSKGGPASSVFMQKDAERPGSGKGGGSKSSNSNKRADDDGDQVVQKAQGADDAPEVKDDNQDKPDEAYNYWEKTKKPPGKTTLQRKQLNAKQNQLHNTIKATMKATLGGGELRNTVKLPENEDRNEWIAVNTVHFYNAANMIYGTCAEFCTEDACKTMSAGAKYEYLWKDDGAYKKPTRVSAPVYIDNLLNWVNERISDPALFPVDQDAKFPRNFESQVKTVYKRLFRLYAHIYYSHLNDLKGIGANAHLNTCFKHFVFFILEFKLVDEEEMAPLKKLIAKFRSEAGSRH